MNTSFRILNEAEINQVGGGHGALQELTILGTMFFILGLPHMIMGIVEFTNWVIDLHHSGCEGESHGHGHSHDHVGDYIKSYYCKAS